VGYTGAINTGRCAVKVSKRNLCKIQESLINMSCPTCNSNLVTLKDTDEEHNAECKDCGCNFEYTLDLSLPTDI
jgi:transcription elongation factor Elf1